MIRTALIGAVPRALRSELHRHLSPDDRRAALTTWRLVRPYRHLALLAVLANVAAAVSEGSTMAVFAIAVQAVVGEADLGSLPDPLGILASRMLGHLIGEQLFFVLVAVGVLTVLLRSAMQFASVAVSVSAQTNVFRDVWMSVFNRFMNMTYRRFSAYKSGDLNQYVWDASNIFTILQQVNMMIGNILIILVYMIILLWFSWPLTMGALLALLIISRPFSRILRKIKNVAQAQLPVRVEMGNLALEFLSGMYLVRIFNLQRHAYELMDGVVSDGMGYIRRAAVWSASIAPLMQSMAITGVAIFLIGGHFVLRESGGAAWSRMLTFLFVLYRLLPMIGSIYERLGEITKRIPIVLRVADMLDAHTDEDLHEGTIPFRGLQNGIEARDVTLRYVADERAALRDLNLYIPKGKMTAIVGASGAGKSTLVHLLLRAYDADRGIILVDGTDLRDLRVADWRQHLAVVTQETFLFHLTVRENIRFGRLDATDQEVEVAARAADADRFIRQLERGYDTIVGDRGHRLSGGQRQRIAIARAVLRHPDVLILDEATSSLDSESERSIQVALERLRENRTVVAIAHRLSTVARADCIVVLNEGHVVEQGTHDELLAQGGHYARYWRLQSVAETRDPDPGEVSVRDEGMTGRA